MEFIGGLFVNFDVWGVCLLDFVLLVLVFEIVGIWLFVVGVFFVLIGMF